MTSTDQSDFRHDRVGSALAGTNPTVLLRLRAGYAVIGDVQHLFLQDMALLGRASHREQD